mgnify:CR=1 FL=1
MKTATLLATVSAASSVTSGAYDLGDLMGYSAQVLLSGSNVAGTLKVQASLDNVTYVDVPGSIVSITSSADQIYNYSDVQYRFFKVDWVYASGTGNITITCVAKEPYKAST